MTDFEQNPPFRMPVPIKYRNRIEYCSISLFNITPETFLKDVASVVPKPARDSKKEIFIYDEDNVLVPIQLVKDVIKLHLHRKGFHLRIEFGENHHIATCPVDMSSAEELEHHLVANNLKNILAKGAKHQKLNKSDLIQLMKVVHDFLIIKTGDEKPQLSERKSLAAAMNQLFPQISIEDALKKLNQRARNAQRTPQNARMPSSEPREETYEIEDPLSSPNDMDCLYEEVEYLDKKNATEYEYVLQ